MAYNLLGQQGPKGSRNPDPNLTDEQATYLYDNPPGQGNNKGLDAKGKPVDKKDVEEKLDNIGQPPTTQPPAAKKPAAKKPAAKKPAAKKPAAKKPAGVNETQMGFREERKTVTTTLSERAQRSRDYTANGF